MPENRFGKGLGVLYRRCRSVFAKVHLELALGTKVMFYKNGVIIVMSFDAAALLLANPVLVYFS